MARHRIVAVTSVVSGVASILLSIALLPWLGLTGVALAALIPVAISTLVVVVPFASRLLGVSAGAMLRDVWGPSVIPGGAAALVLWAANHQGAAGDPVVFVVGLATSAFAYLTIYLLMPAASSERRLLKDLAFGATRAMTHIRLSSMSATQ